MLLATWLTFFVASWLISLSPGAGAISCMSTGMRYGYRRGMWNIVGLQAAILLMVAIVAMGLGAILNASRLAFNLIKWGGVIYLVWLGLAQWRAPAQPMQFNNPTGTTPSQLFLRGFLVNASNPKGIVFMLAVLPQFINPAAPLAIQYAICAATLCFTDLIVMSGYTLLAARVLASLQDTRHIRILNRIFGGLFMAAGLLLASVQHA